MFIDPTNPSTIWCCGYKSITPDYFMSVAMSDNAGSTWTRWELGSSYGRTYCMARDPDDSQVVYVGGYQSNNVPTIYKTENGGGSWTSLALTGLSGYVYDIVIDPTDTSVIYAATSYGVYKSTNGGSTFADVSTFSNTRALLIDPNDHQIVYAATYSQGVYMTSNGGNSWTAMSDGMDANRVNCLGINPGQWLFAGTHGSSNYRWSLVVGVGDETGAPVVPTNAYAAPNPASGSTTIHYQISGTEQVELAVYDMQGRLVSSLVNAQQTPGLYDVIWNTTGIDGIQVPPGVYFFRLTSGAGTTTGKLVLIR
jgi:hypothetical protein